MYIIHKHTYNNQQPLWQKLKQPFDISCFQAAAKAANAHDFIIKGEGGYEK